MSGGVVRVNGLKVEERNKKMYRDRPRLLSLMCICIGGS